MRTLFFAASRAVRLREGVGEGSPDSPWLRILSRRTRASQVPGPSSSCVPWSKDPAGCETLLAHFTERSPSPSGITNPSAPGISNVSRLIPTAHTLAYLRFAGRVTATVARLATGSGGLTLGRAGFAPAGRQTKFHGGIATSIPLRPALPGRTRIAGPLQRLSFP